MRNISALVKRDGLGAKVKTGGPEASSSVVLCVSFAYVCLVSVHCVCTHVSLCLVNASAERRPGGSAGAATRYLWARRCDKAAPASAPATLDSAEAVATTAPAGGGRRSTRWMAL